VKVFIDHYFSLINHAVKVIAYLPLTLVPLLMAVMMIMRVPSAVAPQNLVVIVVMKARKKKRRRRTKRK